MPPHVRRLQRLVYARALTYHAATMVKSLGLRDPSPEGTTKPATPARQLPFTRLPSSHRDRTTMTGRAASPLLPSSVD